MTDLPEGWTTTDLEAVIQNYQSGFASGKKDVAAGVPHLRMNNIGVNGELVLDLVRTVPPPLAKPQYNLTSGDVLVCTTNSSKLVGKCALFDLEGRFAFSNHLTRLRPRPDIISGDYLARYLWLLWQNGEFEDKCKHWVNQSTLPKEELLSTSILLPALDEQRRIVAKVGELLGKVEACQKRLARIPVIFKRFRQSVLAAACSGHLTNDWRAERSPCDAADLLGEIDKTRRQIWVAQRGVKRAGAVPAGYPTPFAPTSEFDLEIPGSWAIASMDQLTCVITSGSRDWKRYYCSDGPGTFVMAQNVRPLRFNSSFRLGVGPPENDRDRARSEVRRNDILVTIVGANTGDVCRIQFDAKDHYVCQSVALMRPVLGETAAFLELFLNSNAHGLRQYRSWIYGEGRPHLSFDHLRQTAVGVPPLAEQREIVRRVDALFKFADRIEHRYKSAQAQIDMLTQSILAKAFRGELVPTEAELARRVGRDYEPASVLLERIGKARSDSTPASATAQASRLQRRRLNRPEGRQK